MMSAIYILQLWSWQMTDHNGEMLRFLLHAMNEWMNIEWHQELALDHDGWAFMLVTQQDRYWTGTGQQTCAHSALTVLSIIDDPSQIVYLSIT